MKNLKEKKYTLLILSILVLFLLDPIADHFIKNFPLTPFLITFIIVSFLWVLGVKKRIVWMNFIIGIIALSVNIYARLYQQMRPEEMPAIVSIPVFSLTILFYVTAIYGILGKVYSEKKITQDTIWGGIVGYFLIGILWGILYCLILILNPDSFSQPAASLNSFKLIYFSFITLTTLGYGDVSPVGHAAMMMAVLEAAIGQIYMAVFVARLIGLEITARAAKNSE